MIDLKEYIREVPHFPKEGVLFKDMWPLLRNYQSILRSSHIGISIHILMSIVSEQIFMMVFLCT